jgi:hypothetical protein
MAEFSNEEYEGLNELKTVQESWANDRKNEPTALQQIQDTSGNLAVTASQAAVVAQNLSNLAQFSVGSISDMAQATTAIRQSDNNVRIMSMKIAADKEKWHALLNHTFSGRNKAIDKFIDLIDKGVKNDNNELILKAMDSLTTIVASSPWPTFQAFNKLIEDGGEIELF